MVLREVSVGARHQHAPRVLLLGMHAQHENLQPRPHPLDALDRVQHARARHRHVEQQHVGPAWSAQPQAWLARRPPRRRPRCPRDCDTTYFRPSRRISWSSAISRRIMTSAVPSRGSDSASRSVTLRAAPWRHRDLHFAAQPLGPFAPCRPAHRCRAGSLAGGIPMPSSSTSSMNSLGVAHGAHLHDLRPARGARRWSALSCRMRKIAMSRSRSSRHHADAADPARSGIRSIRRTPARAIRSPPPGRGRRESAAAAPTRSAAPFRSSIDQRPHRGDAASCRRARQLLGEPGHVDVEPGQRLPQLVVQLAGDRRPLLLADGNQPGRQVAQCARATP